MATKRKRLNKQTLLVLGGVLGVETVGCIGVGMSIHNQKTAMEATLKDKETALTNVRTVSASLPAMAEQYNNMQAQVKFLERALPPADYIPTLLGQVEQTAIGCGIKIQEFRPKASQNGGAAPAPAAGAAGAGAAGSAVTSGGAGATQQQFDMTVVGTYAQIQRFLQELTRFHKILALNSIKIQPATGSKPGAPPPLTTNLTLTAFVLPPAPAPIAISGAALAPTPGASGAPAPSAPGAAKKGVQHSASAAPAPAASAPQQVNQSAQGLSAAAKLAARQGIIVDHGAADPAASRG